MKSRDTVRNLVENGRKILRSSGNCDAEFDAKYIMEEILGEKISVSILKNQNIDKKIADKFLSAIEKRAKNQPLAYIFGRKFFYRNYFFVSKFTLIPRQDSEILVEKAIEFGKKISKEKEVKILDICSGTGCLGFSVAGEISNCKVVFLDICKRAMKVCEKNAKFLNLDKKSEFLTGDILKDDILENLNKKFDIILYNPPYIRQDEIVELDLEVQMEPKKALDGGKDGLKFYRRLQFIRENFFADGGRIFIEIGHDQANDVRKLCGKNCEILKDLNGKDRVILV